MGTFWITKHVNNQCTFGFGYKVLLVESESRVKVKITLTVQSSSHRTSLKFLPRFVLLLRKHTLMIFKGEMGLSSKDLDRLMRNMLLRDKVLLSL